MTGVESSALPPLSPTAAAPVQTKPEVSTPESKLNVYHFYPRLHQLEQEADAVEHQIPLGINRTMLRLSQSLMILQRRLLGANAPPVDISEVEKRLNSHIDFEIEKVTAVAMRKLEEVDEKSKPLGSRVFDMRFQNLREWVRREDRRKEERFARLERDLARLTESYQSSRRSQQIRQFAEGMAEQNAAILSLFQKLADVDRALPTLVPPGEGIDAQNGPNEVRRPKTSIPDIEEPLHALRENIAAFRVSCAQRIADAKEKTEETSQKVKSLRGVINEVSAGAQEIETRVVELNHLCSSLSTQLQEITRATDYARGSKLLASLAIQVQTAHDSIVSDLASIRLQIERFEKTQPLIPG
jgi:chromosome segregation ATPase